VGTVHERLDQGNSPWSDYAHKRASLTQAMKMIGFNRQS